MGKKPFILLAAAGLFALLTSCGDNVIVDGKKGPDKTGTINVYVRDGSGSDSILTGAQVTLLNGSGPKTISQGKGVTYTNVVVGNYEVRATKKTGKDGIAWSGYFASVSLGNDTSDYYATDSSSVFYIPRTATVNAFLYPLTAGLSGTVRSEINGAIAPVPNARVIVEVASSTNIEKRIYTTDADSTGYFAFTNLPAVKDQFEVRALPVKIGDKVYGESFDFKGNAKLNPNGSSFTDAVAYDEQSLVKPLYITKKPLTVDTLGALVFTFDDVLDSTVVGAGAISVVSPKSYPAEHEISRTYAGNTLTISPLRGWGSGTRGIDVEFTNFRSANGNYLASQVVNVQISGVAHEFTLLSENVYIDSLDAAIKLSFSLPVDVAKISSYQSFTTVQGVKRPANLTFEDNNQTLVFTAIDGYWSNAGGTVDFNLGSLLGINGKGLTAYDQINFSVKVRRLVPWFSFKGADSTLIIADSATPIVLNFSDVIDTTKLVVRVTVKDGGPGAQPQPQKWTLDADQKALTITPLLVTGWVGSDVTIKFTDLKSANGEEFTDSVNVKVKKPRQGQLVYIYKAWNSTANVALDTVPGRDHDGPIVLNFSEDIDTSNFVTAIPVEIITGVVGSASEHVESNGYIEVTYGPGSITLTPTLGSRWNFAGQEYFTIRFNMGSHDAPYIISTSGDTLNANNGSYATVSLRVYRTPVNVRTVRVAGLVLDSVISTKGNTNPIVDGATTVRLKWPKLDYDDGLTYNVFRMHVDTLKSIQSYELVKGNIPQEMLFDTVTFTAPPTITSGNLIRKGKNVFVVQAQYGNSTGLLTGDTVSVTTKPTIKGVVGLLPSGTTFLSKSNDSTRYELANADLTNAIVGGTNLAAGASFGFAFTEPMNVNDPKLVDWVNAQAINFKATPKWSGAGDTLTFTVTKTAAGSSITTTNRVVLTHSISGLKSQSAGGQPFFVIYDQLNTDFSPNPVPKATLDLWLWIKDANP